MIDNETNAVKSMLTATPPWALGCIGTLLTFALVLKIVGIDFAEPINVMTDAYSSAVAAQQRGAEEFEAATDRMEALIAQQNSSVNQMRDSIATGLANQSRDMKQLQLSVSEISDELISIKSRVSVLELRSHRPSHTTNP